MKILSIVILMVITISINSCKSNKVISDKEKVTTKIKNLENDFIIKGYFKATVIYDKTKDAPCDYLLQLEKGELLEPLTLKYKEFKKDKKLIWIKFTRQRRVSRCDNAQPMEIIDIKKREE